MKTFKFIKTVLFVAIAAFIYFPEQVSAGDTMTDLNEAEKIVRDVTLILNEATDSKPGQNTSASVLENAVGIAVFPDSAGKAQVAGDGNKLGVLLVRQENDEWGLPLFVNLSNGSTEDQFGEGSSNLVLAFQNRKVLDDLKKGRNTDIFAYKGISSIFPSPGYTSGRNTMRISKDLIAAYYNQPGEKEGLRGYYGDKEECDHMVAEKATMKTVPKSAEMLKYALNSYTTSR